jgi:long-subunit fatty acid transport protein
VGANLNFGASYHFSTKLNIDENYNTEIRTSFDNGEQAIEDVPGEFSYKITRPNRIKAGITILDWNKLNILASAECVFSTNGRTAFDELALNLQEREINDEVQANFEDVVNLRAGLEYVINEQFTPRFGYVYYHSPHRSFCAAGQFISG